MSFLNLNLNFQLAIFFKGNNLDGTMDLWNVGNYLQGFVDDCALLASRRRVGNEQSITDPRR